MKQQPKTRTVWVKCLVVDSDGFPVNARGGYLKRNEKPFYEWVKQSRTVLWLTDPRNRKLWKPIEKAVRA